MPSRPLLPKPGVNTQSSALLTGEQWHQSNLIRFKDGMLQKLGGSVRLSPTPFVGVCRGLHAFSDLTGQTYIGIGTNQRLQLWSADQITDITPILATHNLTTPFSTTNGSAVVSVADGAASVFVGDWVSINNACYVGGLFLQGLYQVTAVIGGGYQFVAGSLATATVAGGGSVLSFTTTLGSHVVTITLGGFAFTNGQSLLVYLATAVGGLTLQGTFSVTVSAGPIYTFSAALAATSAATVSENSGHVQIGYLLHTAIETSSGGGSFGSGAFGSGPFGVGGGVTPPGGSLRQWSEDNWGENLVAAPTNGTIYQWVPPIAVGNVAAALTNAPAAVTGIFVAMPEQQLVAYGCTDPFSGQQDPMLIRWTDVADNTDWTATAINQAGSFRLSIGNQIIGGLQSVTQALLWTDIDLWGMQYVNYPLVYGFNRIGRNCGLRCMRGAVQVGNIVYWIGGQTGFFLYDGTSVQPLRCSVWDFVFDNIDNSYPGAVFAAANSAFNEIAWFFPTQGSMGVVTSYAKVNVLDGTWDYGVLARTAWIDQSIAGDPVAADLTGLLQKHEAGNDNDGVAMDAWAQTGWIGLGDGDEFIMVDRLRPDFILSARALMLVTLYFVDYIGDTPRKFGPYSVTAATEYIIVRGRGRYVMARIESQVLGSFWRLGKIEAQVQPAGRR